MVNWPSRAAAPVAKVAPKTGPPSKASSGGAADGDDSDDDMRVSLGLGKKGGGEGKADPQQPSKQQLPKRKITSMMGALKSGGMRDALMDKKLGFSPGQSDVAKVGVAGG